RIDHPYLRPVYFGQDYEAKAKGDLKKDYRSSIRTTCCSRNGLPPRAISAAQTSVASIGISSLDNRQRKYREVAPPLWAALRRLRRFAARQKEGSSQQAFWTSSNLLY